MSEQAAGTSGTTKLNYLKDEVSIRKIYDSDFRGYRTDNYFISKHKFQIDWSKLERGDQGIEVGVCTLEAVNKQYVPRESWLWELPSKKLTYKRNPGMYFHDEDGDVEIPTPPDTLYPIDYKPKHVSPHKPKGYMDLPSGFIMNLDVEEGTLSFQIDEQDLGVAFKDLKGKHLHLAFFAKRPNFDIKVWELTRPKKTKFF